MALTLFMHPAPGKAESIFAAALEYAGAGRERYVRAACGDDVDLRERVLDLISTHDRTITIGPDRAAPRQSSDRLSNDRFTVERRIGSGGFGTVFAVHDRKRNARVAVKVLSRAGAGALMRFKREFRALSDLSHPNLISMYELLYDGDQWMFTMELIDGVDFVTYARADPSRLPGVVRQVAAGLDALHRMGMLHRDLKPSNVLVTAEGRAVILDFGLVAESGEEEGKTVVGTPGYWAPEQMRGEGAVAASDWYSAGVMFREAIGLLSGIPDYLAELVRDLLREDPASRPSGHEILSRLPEPDAAATAAEPAIAPGLFVGRAGELAQLHEALARSRRGTAVALVHGSSGIGKSALIQHFLAEARTGAVVLAGRCYERESVPYRALDSVMDSIAGHLKRLHPLDAEGLMPRDVATLAELFPVLEQVPAVSRGRRRPADSADVQERRRRAFEALKELLGRMGDERPVIVFIDDLHWGDLDSLAALVEIAGGPEAPRVLIVASYRSEDAGVSPLLKTLLPMWRERVEVVEIALAELPIGDARELAGALAAAGGASAEELAVETGGHPFWIHEMARGGLRGGAGKRLDEIIVDRAGELPAAARQLLDVLAVAGTPLRREIAHRAAGLEEDDPALTAALCGGHFARLRAGGELETYHDRVRESVAAMLSAETTKRCHLGLAIAIEGSGQVADPERLAVHFDAGGDRHRAAKYAIDAAKAAARALAFSGAIRYCRMALGDEQLARGERHEVERLLGDAFSHSGRGEEAAQAYLESARSSADAVEALDLRRRAAEQLLVSGKIDSGLAVLRDVLRPVGMKLTVTKAGALAVFMYWNLRLRLRGLHFQAKTEAEIPVDRLLKMDACGTAAIGLGSVDPIRGMAFAPRWAVLALEGGNTSRISRALALLAAYLSYSGSRSIKQVDPLIAAAAGLAERTGRPIDRVMVATVRGLRTFMNGQWAEARERLPDPGSMVGVESVDVMSWQKSMTRIADLTCLHMLGEFTELSASVPLAMRDARERDDQYLVTSIRNRLLPFVHLAADRPGEGRRDLLESMNNWSVQGFHLQHYFNIYSRSEIDLYTGDAKAVWRRIRATWPHIRGAYLTHFQMLVIEAHHLEARAAILMAIEAAGNGEGTGKMLAAAEAKVRLIDRERSGWGGGVSALIRAGVASVRDDRAAVERHLAEAESIFTRAHMKHYMAACRMCRGESVAEYCAAEGIKNPERFLGALAPGRWR